MPVFTPGCPPKGCAPPNAFGFAPDRPELPPKGDVPPARRLELLLRGVVAPLVPPPPEVRLPKDFPTDRVPLPSGARVTSSTSFGQGGQKTYIITYFTKSSPDDVAKYFSDEMPKHGWSSAFSSNSNGELFVTFTSGDTGSGSNDGLTVTASDSTDTPGYTQVGVSVSLTGTTP